MDCSVPGCDRKAHAKGMCQRHYQRMRTRGTTDIKHPSKGLAPDGRPWKGIPEAEAFLLRIDSSGGPDACWPWLGDKTVLGYPKMNGRSVTRLVAGTPAGMQTRHTCDNPPCVNPAHLLVGTAADNVADMMERGRHRTNSATMLAQPTCRSGHPRTPEHARMEYGRWRCLTCRRIAAERRRTTNERN